MRIQAFNPKFMKVGILTAAIQELTPREVRDNDPDRAIEEWIAYARELGADLIQLSSALHPTRNRRASRGDAGSGGQHAGSAEAVRQGSRQARARRDGVRARRDFRSRLLRQPAPPRSGHPQEEARFHAAHLRRGGAPRCQRGLRIRRPQPAAQHGPEPDRLRGVVRTAPAGRQGARPDLSRRAVPDARLDHERQLAQQHRVHARARGSRCTGSARSTRSATSSAFTTIRRTPS